jgi:hypothetical protein
MISNLVAFFVLLPAAQAAPVVAEPSAGPLISKMFLRYATAKSLAGGIEMNQTADGHTVNIRTEVQYQEPSKVFIRQTRTSSQPRAWLVTSDGVHFSYDRPQGVLGLKNRFMDLVDSRQGPMSVRDIYLAVSLSLGDKSAPLDIAFGRTDDLRVIKALWGNLTIAGQTDFKGKKVNLIHGGFRESFGGPLIGSLELLISDEGDLLRMKTVQTLVYGNVTQPITVGTLWDVNLVVDGPVNDTLFTVVK